MTVKTRSRCSEEFITRSNSIVIDLVLKIVEVVSMKCGVADSDSNLECCD